MRWTRILSFLGLMVWTPRPLIHGLALGPGCAERHPNKARRVRDGSYNDRDRFGKECVRGVRCGEQRAIGNAPATLRRAQVLSFMRGLAALRGRDGGQRRSAVLGAPVHRARARGAADESGAGDALPQGQQDRPQRLADAILEAVTRPSMRFVEWSRVWRSRTCSRCTECGPSWSRAAPPCATSCAVSYASAAWWCGPARRRLSAACRRRWRMRVANYPARCASC